MNGNIELINYINSKNFNVSYDNNQALKIAVIKERIDIIMSIVKSKTFKVPSDLVDYENMKKGILLIIKQTNTLYNKKTSDLVKNVLSKSTTNKTLHIDLDLEKDLTNEEFKYLLSGVNITNF